MVQDNGKSYQMYVLNLDNSRIFWLSLLFLIIFGLCFLLGMFLGRSGAPLRAAQSGLSETRDTEYDNFLLSKMSIVTQNNDFEFYRVLNKEKLSREDIEHSIPYKRSEVGGFQSGSVENKYPEPPKKQTQKVSSSENDSANRTDIKNAGKKTGSRDVSAVKTMKSSRSDPGKNASITGYSIQVASYVNNNTAEISRKKLAHNGYKAYVVKGMVTNRLYFRLRVGPFTSKEKASLALARLKSDYGFSGAYLCSR